LPLLDAAPDQAVKFLADHQSLMYLWNLIVDWGSAITLVIMLLALYERLKPGSLTIVRAAVIFGLLWAVLTFSNGSLILHNFGVVANLYGSVPAQAAAWTAMVRSLWVLLLDLAAVRKAEFPRLPACLGVFLAILGLLTLIPAIAEPVFMIFGPGMMVWSAWVGIVMLSNSAAVKAQQDDMFVQRH
jgi:hypothetical protein